MKTSSVKKVYSTEMANGMVSNHSMSKFRMSVLEVVRGIPLGTVMTYGEIACMAGNPGASRAVGTFMKQNYDPTVPCHRVVKSNGEVGEYNRGGSKAKRALLKKEGVIFRNAQCVQFGQLTR